MDTELIIKLWPYAARLRYSYRTPTYTLPSYPTWLCVRRGCALFTRIWWRLLESPPNLWWLRRKNVNISCLNIVNHNWVPAPSRGLGGLDWQENEPGTSRPTPSRRSMHSSPRRIAEWGCLCRIRTQDGNYVQLQNNSHSMSLNGKLWLYITFWNIQSCDPESRSCWWIPFWRLFGPLPDL